MQYKIMGILCLLGLGYRAAAQTIGYAQGGFIADKYAVEVGYTASDDRISLGANQIRIGGKFDNIYLGVGLQERRQFGFVGSTNKLSSIGVDLGYDLAFARKSGLNMMLMQTFSMPTTVEPTSYATIKEGITVLSLLYYKQFDIGKFFLKPAAGLGAQIIGRTVDASYYGGGNLGGSVNTLTVQQKEKSAFLLQARLQVGLGATFSGVRIAATPFLYTEFLTPYFGFNVGAAYNFKTETAFDGKAK